MKGHRPSDIYLIPLLALRYASMFPEKVQWGRSVMLHPRCEDVLYALWASSDLFQNYHLKIKAKTSLQRYARQHNIFLSNRIVLKIYDHRFLGLVRRWCELQTKRNVESRPEWFSYYTKRTSVILKAQPVWKRKIMNVQAYISNCQFSQITFDPTADCLSLRGADFIRMPVTLNFPSIDDPAEPKEPLLNASNG